MCTVGTIGKISDYQPEGPQPSQKLNLVQPSFAIPSVGGDIKLLV